MSAELDSMRIACKTMGVNLHNDDRFCTNAIRWLTERCVLSIDQLEDRCFSIIGERDDEVIFCSPDERLSWALSGAVHACQSWMEDHAKSVQDSAGENLE